MNIDLGSLAFGSYLEEGTGTPSWGTALGQSRPEYYITREGADELLVGMLYSSVPLDEVSLPLGKGGKVFSCDEAGTIQLASVFHKVYVNGLKVPYPFIIVLQKEDSESHNGRRGIKYTDKATYKDGETTYTNARFFEIVRSLFGLADNACWFVYDISVQNYEELYLKAVFVNKEESEEYVNSRGRSEEWTKLIEESGDSYAKIYSHSISVTTDLESSPYRPYLTALRTKPFLLLAGISGTGKSRIVRELARACWQPTDDEYKAHKPRNFEMVQVKPNWHDSSELIGYVSRIGEKPEFVAGDFLKFVAKAWSEPTVPYFLCLDEMNLAPVEQYFAEYLSVIESRKLEDGKIVTDPLLKKEVQEWYLTLVSTLTNDENLHEQFLNEGISIPQNLFVVGTVNMDETTFSFSRKVLDRAMTIEMNEVDLNGGLEENAASEFGYIGPKDEEPSVLIPFAVEGKDVYSANKDLCDKVIEYLQAVNAVLDKTPFKIAYRTRNEFLVYAVCRGEEYLNNALDEMTSMKILSRIEGDADKTERVLNDLDDLLKKAFEGMEKSDSLAKIDEMKEKLKRTQYTSFWS
ncbi:MAG: AAA family ATPase [Paludibacteraceae bacterium]|nr:AAA family ATPase [Paludibacteraceae bacterium]